MRKRRKVFIATLSAAELTLIDLLIDLRHGCSTGREDSATKPETRLPRCVFCWFFSV
jgi:hypothetical protein